jgi:hypothetical protein
MTPDPKPAAGETTNVTRAADCTHVDAINAGKNTTCKCGAVIRFMEAPSPASSPRKVALGNCENKSHFGPHLKRNDCRHWVALAEKPEGERPRKG